MKLTITGSAKEIAALVLAVQERQVGAAAVEKISMAEQKKALDAVKKTNTEQGYRERMEDVVHRMYRTELGLETINRWTMRISWAILASSILNVIFSAAAWFST